MDGYERKLLDQLDRLEAKRQSATCHDELHAIDCDRDAIAARLEVVRDRITTRPFWLWYAPKLYEAKVYEILEAIEAGQSRKDIAAEAGVSRGMIRLIDEGICWRSVWERFHAERRRIAA